MVRMKRLALGLILTSHSELISSTKERLPVAF